MCVKRSPFGVIRLALIPDYASNRKMGHRGDHSVEKSGWSPGGKVRMPVSPWNRLAFGLGLLDGLLVVALLHLQLQGGCFLRVDHLRSRRKDRHQRCVR